MIVFSSVTLYLKMYDSTDLVSIFVEVSLRCERIPLLVVEVLLQVEECVEEDRRHLALLQVLQSDGVLVQGADHVKHLKGEGELVN